MPSAVSEVTAMFGYDGVSWLESEEAWQAQIELPFSTYNLGTYATEHAAGRAFNDFVVAQGLSRPLNKLSEESAAAASVVVVAPLSIDAHVANPHVISPSSQLALQPCRSELIMLQSEERELATESPTSFLIAAGRIAEESPLAIADVHAAEQRSHRGGEGASFSTPPVYTHDGTPPLEVQCDEKSSTSAAAAAAKEEGGRSAPAMRARESLTPISAVERSSSVVVAPPPGSAKRTHAETVARMEAMEAYNAIAFSRSPLAVRSVNEEDELFVDDARTSG
jgi:hypothetical protein